MTEKHVGHKVIKFICLLLVIIGGLNWGLVGIANFNLVSYFFGDMSMLARIIYVVVGVAAVLTIFLAPCSCVCKKTETQK